MESACCIKLSVQILNLLKYSPYSWQKIRATENNRSSSVVLPSDLKYCNDWNAPERLHHTTYAFCAWHCHVCYRNCTQFALFINRTGEKNCSAARDKRASRPGNADVSFYFFTATLNTERRRWFFCTDSESWISYCPPYGEVFAPRSSLVSRVCISLSSVQGYGIGKYMAYIWAMVFYLFESQSKLNVHRYVVPVFFSYVAGLATK